MNRPTPSPSQEGSRHSSASRPFPSLEGLGVGSWSQYMRQSERRLSMNRAAAVLAEFEAKQAVLFPFAGVASVP